MTVTKKRRSVDLNEAKASSYGDKAPNLTDLVDMLEWPKQSTFVPVRLIGPLVSVGLHKIDVKKKDGTATQITKPCLAWDDNTQTRDSTKKCPYCKLNTQQHFSARWFANVIDRRLVESKPSKVRVTPEERKSGFKDMSSQSWTPVRVVGIPASLLKRIQEINTRNFVKKGDVKKQFNVNHTKYGADIELKFNLKEQAANMYSAVRSEEQTEGKFSPLTEDEGAYLQYDLDVIYPLESEEEATEQAKRLKKINPKGVADEDDDEDDAPKKGKSKKSSRDDDDDEDLDDEDDEPKKSKSKKKKDEDDEDLDDLDGDDDDEEEEEDEDDEPPKKKKKPSRDDDEDDEPAPKKKKPAKKSSRDDDDDLDEEEEEEEEDEEEEDEPPKKSKSKKPAKKSSRDDDDDDLDDLDEEEEDEEEDEEEEEEEEPPVKKKKRR